jgi:hypothetical protein
MREFNGVYAQAYNRKRRRIGHVLQGRYMAIGERFGLHHATVSRVGRANDM